MTRDFAVKLAEFFWHMGLCINVAMFFFIHMTWELCADLFSEGFFHFLTDEMGDVDQIDR